MSGNKVKHEDMDRVMKLLELLGKGLGDEQEGWVKQKELANDDEVKALLPSVRNTSCWLGQAISFCGIGKTRLRDGIRYHLDRDTIIKAQERIKSMLYEHDNQAEGRQGDDVDDRVGG